MLAKEWLTRGLPQMTALAFSDTVKRQHVALAQRLEALLGASGHGPARILRTAQDPAPVGPAPALTLERAAQPQLRRLDGRGRFHLTYREPSGEASLAAALAALTAPGAPIAADPESLSVLALAERLAASEIPVLIAGPTGTGKEVLSRFIHDHSPRRDGPFVAVNCAAMPEAMLEALLFGHQKGAFTGATQASEGFFRAADGGTLLLDEIAEMPLALQAKRVRDASIRCGAQSHGKCSCCGGRPVDGHVDGRLRHWWTVPLRRVCGLALQRQIVQGFDCGLPRRGALQLTSHSELRHP